MSNKKKQKKFSFKGDKLFAKILSFFVILVSLIWMVNYYYLDNYSSDYFYLKEKSLMQDVMKEINLLDDTSIHESENIQNIIKKSKENGFKVFIVNPQENKELISKTIFSEKDSKIINYFMEQNNGFISNQETKSELFFIFNDTKNVEKDYIQELFHNKNHLTMYSFKDETMGVFVQMDFSQGQQVIDEIHSRMTNVYLFIFVVATLLSFRLYIELKHPLKKLSDMSKKLADKNFKNAIEASSDDFLSIEQGFVEAADSLEVYRQENINMISELNVKNEQQRLLISNMSHELKTPLSIISLYLEMLKTKVDESKEFEIIEEEIERIELIINNSISLFKTGTNNVSISEVDISTIIKSRALLLEPKFKEKGINLILDVDEDSSVNMDELSAQYVIDNYLSNALKYSPNDSDVVVKYSSHIFSIKNTGNIKEEHVNKIWDYFYKIDESRVRDEESSSGLGLSIVKSIGDKYGFNYWVISEEDSLTFCFEFKRKELND